MLDYCLNAIVTVDTFAFNCEGATVMMNRNVGRNGKTLFCSQSMVTPDFYTSIFLCHLSAYGDDDRRRSFLTTKMNDAKSCNTLF